MRCFWCFSFLFSRVSYLIFLLSRVALFWCLSYVVFLLSLFSCLLSDISIIWCFSYLMFLFSDASLFSCFSFMMFSFIGGGIIFLADSEKEATQCPSSFAPHWLIYSVIFPSTENVRFLSKIWLQPKTSNLLWTRALPSFKPQSDHEIKRSIGIAKTTFKRMKNVMSFRCISMQTEYRLLVCHVW